MGFYFVVAGLVICLYQACRGFVFQWLVVKSNNWKTVEGVLLFCLAEAFFYFVCAALGCLSIALAYHIVFNGPPLWEMSASTVALLALLAFLGVTGVTGQLPTIIQRLRLSVPGTSAE